MINAYFKLLLFKGIFRRITKKYFTRIHYRTRDDRKDKGTPPIVQLRKKYVMYMVS